MSHLGIEPIAVEIVIAAFAIHTVYLILKFLWKHRNVSGDGSSSRRTAFTATISFETNSEPPPPPPAKKPRELRARRVREIGP